ncbi:hypothetical protein BB561_001207 [Smittium simulii]|uniref:Uncharacterized protein n=1 Tax=Smittium simulii TaxID=133385 RepID=A0A2T9YVN3_9FUNG|nr:hypothetical protein BB561_001207 [Smittium simulii]
MSTLDSLYLYYIVSALAVLCIFILLKAFYSSINSRRAQPYTQLGNVASQNQNTSVFNRIYAMLNHLPTTRSLFGNSNQHFIPVSNEYSPAINSGTHHDSGFIGNIVDGLSSENFNLVTNLAAGDSRNGLENAEEIKKIMESRCVSFDTARLIRQQCVFARNNIDPSTGLPLDPKAVVFG